MSFDNILVIDDEPIIKDFIVQTIARLGLEAESASCGNEALDLFKEKHFDLVITDMKMPDISGIEVLKKIKTISPETLVVIITAYGSIDNAVEAMRLGAFNYLVKPFSPEAIATVVEKAQEHHSLVSENEYLRKTAGGSAARSYSTIIAESPQMKKILDDVSRVAKSSASVFITGESGTGKEIIAHAVHYQSPRKQKPFIKINCAAVPSSLIESEFFGHEKGAFTGANFRKLGRFELANHGTLLLDEVSEIPSNLQAKLLRVTQEQEFERVGGTKPIRVDVRLISTSNRSIEELIQKEILREDLYYRLNVVPIYLPPLRERPEDIIPLSEYFIKNLCMENHKKLKLLTEDAKKLLLNYSWPGNIRELINIIERIVVMNYEKKVTAEHILPSLSTMHPVRVKQEDTDHMTLQDLEKQHIIEMLQKNQDNVKQTAKDLGISLSTLRNKMRQYKLT
ncbi:MAG: sigma-54 dependent transcriptional regulator [Chlamydiales bacterium]